MIPSYFGWKQKPFGREIATKNLYRSAQYQELEARLKYMIQDRSFGCITGEVGAGKTTAIRALRDQLNTSHHVFLYISDSSLRPRDFYREMLVQIGVEPRFLASDVKRQFKAALLELFEVKKKTPVVIIDEAHLLSPAMLQEIRFLTNFHVDSISPLALILVGQPELRDKLRLRSLEAISQRITTRFHLVGFSYDDMKAYIQHHLRQVGEDRQIFSEAALSKIYKQTRGIMRLINNLCTECLLDAVSRQQKIIDEDSVDRVIDEHSF
ncbi:AAA family ATPase [Lederbergia sp. NSJ-179]|uniref:ExeA family protein n=1 Tax=Bacillaceae TaxID=186817 RepID=UPI001FD3DA17|nr:AAA family ATPase [Lederbergia sp. NSJ-179]MCJ7843379.1 AAA family ATPase [Lederbergia sp. NSJ-179]